MSRTVVLVEREWEDAVKVHEGCGGVCYWEEAVMRPGVGWHGTCMRCDASRLAKEDMIPVEVWVGDRRASDESVVKQVRAVPVETRERLTWDGDVSWDENQQRIREALGLRPLGGPSG